MHFSRSGLTLIEVIISIALISLLTLSATLISLAIFRSWQGEAEYTNQRFSLSTASEAISRELRGSLEVSSVQPSQISLWLDFNDNGLKDIPDEQVAYSWSGVAGASLYRSQGLSLNQEILKNLNNFSITCLGQDNQLLNFPISDTSLIRALQIRLTSNVNDEAINLLFSLKVRNL